MKALPDISLGVRPVGLLSLCLGSDGRFASSEALIRGAVGEADVLTR
jgi:hypothetical protein